MATITTTEGVTFIYSGTVNVPNYLQQLSGNPIWHNQLLKMAAGGKTEIYISDNPEHFTPLIGNRLWSGVYGGLDGENSGATLSPLGMASAHILLNNDEGQWQNGAQIAVRNRLTSFVHEVMHISTIPIALDTDPPNTEPLHNGIWTSVTQQVLDFQGPSSQPNRALAPHISDPGLPRPIFSAPNPVQPIAPLAPLQALALVAPGFETLANDDGYMIV